MACLAHLTLILLFSYSNGLTKNTIPLNGVWDVTSYTKGIQIKGNVPGSIYTALTDSILIADPYFRDNDVQYRWIGRQNWTYSRLFDIYPDMLAKSNIMLVAEGLDTFSTILVNDKVVGTSNNMFHPYVFDIKNTLLEIENNITIVFKSAVLEAERLANQSSYDIPPDCPDPAQHGECHRNFIRKEQCSFSWDWGPSFPGQGIWKNISIEYYNDVSIRGLTALPRLLPNKEWSVDITLHLDVNNENITGVIEVFLDKHPSSGLSSTLLYQKQTVAVVNSDIYYPFNVSKDYPIDLWWPNGYGEQDLYNLTVRFTSSRNHEVVSKSVKIGFRTVKLVQDPVSNNASQGLTFYFEINNVPVFFKGTNWIPADSFLERVTKTRLERHLRSAAEVHINSMRVWGGGVYESDEFYELCDELGIMLWHDLMFSDALYPVNNDFLNSVIKELKYQINRLSYHPSIVLWSGNNENEGIASGQKNEQLKKDYVTLYIDTIMNLVNIYDTSRPFVVSSPSNGPESKKEGWIAKNPGSEYYGDDHFYNYDDDLWDWKTFPIPRFASEFGSEAWCNFDTLEDVFDQPDFDYNSPMANHRQHHPYGNDQMLKQTAMHIYLPTTNDTQQKFQDLIYLIQIHQAMAIKTEAEHYRRFTNQLLSDGRGLTMGTLYWQLNDIWQAPTWASIDYAIKWKMLHYYVRKFYDPNLISPYIDGSDLKVYMVLDELLVSKDTSGSHVSLRPMKSMSDMIDSGYQTKHREEHVKKSVLASEGTVYMDVYTWSSLTPLKTFEIPFNLNMSSGLILDKNIDAVLNGARCPERKNCFLYFSLNSKSSPTSTNWLPLAEFKDFKLPKTNVVIDNVEPKSTSEFTITLTTDNVAAFVWLNSGGTSGRFSDNGFIMKDPKLQVTFTAWEPIDIFIFKEGLKVQSLVNVYQ